MIEVERDAVLGEIRVELDRATRWVEQDLHLSGLSLFFFKGADGCLGYVDRGSPHLLHVNVDEPRQTRLWLVLHEGRHAWQGLKGTDWMDQPQREANATAWADANLPRLLEALR